MLHHPDVEPRPEREEVRVGHVRVEVLDGEDGLDEADAVAQLAEEAEATVGVLPALEVAEGVGLEDEPWSLARGYSRKRSMPTLKSSRSSPADSTERGW